MTPGDSDKDTLDHPGPPPKGEARLSQLLALAYRLLPHLALGVANQAWWGYSSGRTNHCMHLPIVRRILDPSLYPGDPMVDAARGKYVSYYYHFLALLGRLFGGLELPLFASNVLFIGLFFATSGSLASTAFGNSASVLLTVALMWPKRFDLQLGGGFLQREYNMQTFATTPLALLAVNEHLRGRPGVAFALLGAMFNFNGLGAMYVSAMLGVVSLLRVRERGALGTARDYGLFFLLALPAIIWHLQSSAGEPLTAEWIALMKARSASHSFPSTWPAAQYYRYALFFAAGLLCWSYTRSFRLRERIDTSFGLFGALFLLLCAVGYLFSETWPLRTIILAQPFRASSYVTLFVLLYIADATRRLWQQGDMPRRITAAILFVGALLPEYRGFLALAAALMVLVERERLPIWAGLPALATAMAFPFVPANKPVVAGLTPLATLVRTLLAHRLATVAWAALIGWQLLKRLFSANWRHLVAIGLFMLWYPIVIVAGYKQLVKPPAKRDDWHAVQVWASRHTPKSARFLTPPMGEGFRVYSRRGIVAEWKDGTIAYVDSDYGRTWWERTRAIPKRQSYDRLTEKKAVALAHEYDAQYIVTRKPRHWSLPEVFRKGRFRVYGIPPPVNSRERRSAPAPRR